MTAVMTPVLTAWDEPDSFTIEGYKLAGDYQV